MQVLYRGLDNWNIRYLASGKNTYMIMARSYRDSTFLNTVGKLLSSMDIESLNSQWVVEEGQNRSFTSKDDRRDASKAYATHIFQQMKECSSKGTEDRMLARIATLEMELAKKRSTPSRGTPASARKGASNSIGEALMGSGGRGKPEGKETPKDKFNKMARREEEAVLERHIPLGKGLRVLAQWRSKIGFPAGKVKQIDNKIKEVTNNFGNLKGDNKKNAIYEILIEWGMPVTATGN